MENQFFFKTETHLHTAEVSTCGRLSAAEMIQWYYEAGYHTVFVTDHLNRHTLEHVGGESWEEQVDHFCTGYKAAKQEGDRLGLTILFAAEVKLDGMGYEYLLYGADPEFLKQRDFLSMTLPAFSQYVHEHQMLLIQAHPYRDGVHFPTPDYVDGLEAVNSNPRHENNPEKGFALAKQQGLLVTGGSDAHRVEDVAGSGIMTREPICTAADYIRMLRSGKYEIIGREAG